MVAVEAVEAPEAVKPASGPAGERPTRARARIPDPPGGGPDSRPTLLGAATALVALWKPEAVKPASGPAGPVLARIPDPPGGVLAGWG